MKYVIAGNYHQFRLYCKRRNLRERHDARWVGREIHLMGLTGVTIVLTGLYQKHEDWPSLFERIEILEKHGFATVVHDPY